MESRKIHVIVMVLGDVGRSPRMQYHTDSLLSEGHTVTLVGYHGTDLIPSLKGDNLSICRFGVPGLPIPIRALYLLWRASSLTVACSWILLKTAWKADVILIQNPPAIPIMLVAFIVTRLVRLFTGKRPKLVVDWHNLGYSMLPKGTAQKLARVYEQRVGPLADGHFTVTRAMKDFLKKEFALQNIHVLYDCPPPMFQAIRSENEKHQLLKRILTDYDESSKLVTSATSWTPDEDFGMLLDALEKLDDRIAKESSRLRIVVAITGKGPLKEFYQAKMAKQKLQAVKMTTLWLSPEDYPRFVACADLAVSLHTSTSGLDLPMKILDAHGCCVPVCARGFACLDELVREPVFNTSEELAGQLWDLLGNNSKKLQQYAQQLRDTPRWHENWKEYAWPLLNDLTDRHNKES